MMTREIIWHYVEKYDFYVEDSEHIHGSLIDDGNLILGIDTAKCVDDNYSFFF